MNGAEDSDALMRLGDELYDRYGRPLEAAHWGRYLAVSRDGKSVLADTAEEAAGEGERRLPRGFFLFKVGEIAVAKVR